MNYANFTKDELISELNALKLKAAVYAAKGIALDLSRGKPCAEQLELSMPMLDKKLDYMRSADYRNYGILEGIPEVRRLMADLLSVRVENVLALGNSSLNLMYDAVARAVTFGVAGGQPWEKGSKFLCPVPGYDRHFKITETFGIEMINVPMTKDGPDMDVVEELIKDESVKGIWCVPKFSNPDGIVYSDETVRRMANLRPASKSFRIFWDNAYFIHEIYDSVPMLNILEEAEKVGNEDIVYMFASTSKMTFPGSGIAFFIASENNINFTKKYLAVQTIGPDKMSQLMHAEFFPTADALKAHMAKHAEILRPKFDMLCDSLEALHADGVVDYVKPRGGYFASVFLKKGTAKRTVELCKKCGVTLTPAGATYPYGIDPDDSNIRMAPSFADMAELKMALEVFDCCARISHVESLLK